MPTCHVEPPQALRDAAPILTSVASLIENGGLSAARVALFTIDADACHAYWTACATAGLGRHRPAEHVGRIREKRRGVTRSLKLELGERDGWRCRYCGLRVVAPEYFRALQRLLPDDFPMAKGSPVLGTAWPIQRVFDASPDHVEPVSAGGPHTLDNMVTACGACNYQMKGDCTLEELGLDPPGPPVVDEWDGLVGRPLIPSVTL